MSLLTPKNPRDMTREELNLYHKEMQAEARQKGQHYPTTMHNGKVHEGTLRKEAAAHHEQRYAQNTAAGIGRGISMFDSIANAIGMVTGAQKQINQYSYNDGYLQGSQGALVKKGSIPKGIPDSNSWWLGYKEGYAKFEASRQ